MLGSVPPGPTPRRSKFVFCPVAISMAPACIRRSALCAIKYVVAWEIEPAESPIRFGSILLAV